MPLHVGILPHADLPHIVPCFRIGRELLKAGHDVSVLGSDVQKIGRGHSESWHGQLAAFGLSGRQIVHRSSSITISDWLVHQSRELRLDVVILDAVWQGLAYGCQDSSSTSVVVHHAGLPDFRSSDMPTWYFVHPGHSREQWASARRANELCELAGHGVRGLFSSMKALSDEGRKARDIYGFGCGELEALPAIRAMSLCPAAEFPDERGRVVYFGTLLPKRDDIDWKPLPSEVNGSSQTLIACVFGTTGLQTREEYEWLLSLAKTLARHFVDCQVLVVVPESRRRDSRARDYPGNLLVYPWIPLWELLSTRLGSKVLVTAPGVGAFREATASGTPIVAIPRKLDQFGAAARVEYFGTGSALVSAGLPPPELVVKRVAHVLEDSNVALNAERLRREFIAFDANRPLIRFMDGLARG
jgi:hypothetical protein